MYEAALEGSGVEMSPAEDEGRGEPNILVTSKDDGAAGATPSAAGATYGTAGAVPSRVHNDFCKLTSAVACGASAQQM